MHSKMIVLKSPSESIDDIDNTVSNYWESDDINLSERYDIDYYDETSIDIAVDILRNYFPENFKFDKNTKVVTLTLKGVVKYLYGRIREINSFIQENKPIDKFTDNLYSLQLIILPDHPKVLTSYFGMYDMMDFARGLYRRMIRDKISKLEYEVYKCYDYHV